MYIYTYIQKNYNASTCYVANYLFSFIIFVSAKAVANSSVIKYFVFHYVLVLLEYSSEMPMVG